MTKKMEKIQISVKSATPILMGSFSEMPLKDLEYYIRELSALAVRKRAVDSDKRDKFLLRKINQTVLPEPALERYIALQEKMELEKLSETEYEELLNLVSQEEKIRNKRFQYLLELAQLRSTPLAQLMNTLGLNALNYA